MSADEDADMKGVEHDQDPVSDDDEVSESESESDSEEASARARSAQLREQVRFNPSYELYVEYISALRSSHDLKELRGARKDMADRFPLSEEVWISWIDDEKKLGFLKDSSSLLRGLYEQAVDDCPVSVRIWLSFCEWSCADVDANDAKAVEACRQLFERSLNTAALHYHDGHQLFDAYRSMERGLDDGVERVRKLFHRQLSVVCEQLDQVFAFYSKEFPNVPPHIRKSYEKTRKLCVPRREYENDGSVPSASYLRLEAREKPLNVARLVCLYERALQNSFNDAALWNSFLRFLRLHRKLPDLLMSCCRRAVRHCNWSSALWCAFIQSASLINQSHENVSAIFEEAVAVSFQSTEDFINVATEMCIYERRRFVADPSNSSTRQMLLDAFEQASKYTQYEPTLSDASYNLYRLWANVEARDLNSLSAAFTRWESLVSKGGKDSRIWLEYISFARSFDSTTPEQIRKLFRRALHLLQGDGWALATLCGSWRQWERECGTSQEEDEASYRSETLLADFQEKQQRLQKKRAAEQLKLPSAKKCRKNAVEGASAIVVPEKCAEETSAKAVESSPEKIKLAKAGEDEEKQAKKVVQKPPTEESATTAFVLNLPWTVNEGDLAIDFAKFGTVTSARLVRDYKGRSRGFAYIDFQDEQSVDAAAAALHQKMYRGRVIEVSRSAPPTSADESVEKVAKNTTVFVKGLDSNRTAHDLDGCLRALLRPCGPIKTISVPTQPNSNKVKGFAFVVFSTEDGCAKSLKVSDTTTLGPKACIFLSKPKTAAPKQREQTQRKAGPRRHKRLRETSDEKHPNPEPEQEQEEKAAAKPMSNADFKNLFGKKH